MLLDEEDGMFYWYWCKGTVIGLLDLIESDASIHILGVLSWLGNAAQTLFIHRVHLPSTTSAHMQSLLSFFACY